MRRNGGTPLAHGFPLMIHFFLKPTNIKAKPQVGEMSAILQNVWLTRLCERSQREEWCITPPPPKSQHAGGRGQGASFGGSGRPRAARASLSHRAGVSVYHSQRAAAYTVPPHSLAMTVARLIRMGLNSTICPTQGGVLPIQAFYTSCLCLTQVKTISVVLSIQIQP